VKQDGIFSSKIEKSTNKTTFVSKMFLNSSGIISILNWLDFKKFVKLFESKKLTNFFLLESDLSLLHP